MANFPVKWFQSSMPGCPDLVYEQVGSLLEVLKAVLVDGFNETPVDALTYDPEASEGIIEISAGGHGFMVNQIIEVAGASPAEYNGQWRATKVTNSFIHFVMDVVPSANGTGTITVKTPGAGWTMPYVSADGFRAVFKPDDTVGAPCYLYIDNTDYTLSSWTYSTSTSYPSAFARGYHHVSGIDDRYSEFGAGLLQWYKYSVDPDNLVRDYHVFADNRTFYLCHKDENPEAHPGYRHQIVWGFGALDSPRQPRHPDYFLATIVNGDETLSVAYGGHLFGRNTYQDCHNTLRCSSASGPVSSDAELNPVLLIDNSSDKPIPFSPLSGDIVIIPQIPAVVDNPKSFPVGNFPGVSYVATDVEIPDKTTMTLEGRLSMVHTSMAIDYLSETQTLIFDLDGPWKS